MQVIVVIDIGIVAVVVSMQVEGSSSGGGGRVVGAAEWVWWLCCCCCRCGGGHVHQHRWQNAGGADGCIIDTNRPSLSWSHQHKEQSGGCIIDARGRSVVIVEVVVVAPST